jgi:hypothetical protein
VEDEHAQGPFPSVILPDAIMRTAYPRPRDVSGASHFPMRQQGPSVPPDPTAYQATEIPQTPMILEPIDKLPENLPYPLLATTPSRNLDGPSSLANSTSSFNLLSSAHSKGGLFSSFRAGVKKEKDKVERIGSPEAGLHVRSSMDQHYPRASHEGNSSQIRVRASPLASPAGPRDPPKRSSITARALEGNLNQLASQAEPRRSLPLQPKS